MTLRMLINSSVLEMMGYRLSVVLLAGCATGNQRGAMVSDGTIRNSSLGFSVAVPEGLELYALTAENPKQYTEAQ